MRPFFTVANVKARQHFKGFSIDGVTLEQLRASAPTPFYVTSLSAVASRAHAYLNTLRSFFPRGQVHYAMKANFAPSILTTVKAAGLGVDIVSIGEWRAALKVGFKPADVCFAGVGKTPAQWREALAGGVGIVNVEHVQELQDILDLLEALPADAHRPLIAIRLNPCVESNTHPHLKTGALDSKFGMLLEQLSQWLNTRKTSQAEQAFQTKQTSERWKNYLAPLSGIHVHIGSQLLNPEVFELVVEKVFEAAELLRTFGTHIAHIDLGGGLGVGFDGVPPDNSDIINHVSFLCQTILRVAKNHPELASPWGHQCQNLSVNLEPGRSVVASSTALFTEVLYEKSNSELVHFAYVDAGMNDFPRPSIYNARHAVVLANKTEWGPETLSEPLSVLRGELLNADAPPEKNYTVVGPVCESGDVLARNAALPQLARGDWLVFLEAGAYCRSMASHYNLRPLPAEIFVQDGKIVDVTNQVDA